jgi:hypothetical protein
MYIHDVVLIHIKHSSGGTLHSFHITILYPYHYDAYDAYQSSTHFCVYHNRHQTGEPRTSLATLEGERSKPFPFPRPFNWSIYISSSIRDD